MCKAMKKLIKNHLFRQLKTIEDYKKDNTSLEFYPKRHIPKICIIDDIALKGIQHLRNIGYKSIEQHYDFGKIEDYENYDIILCDIADVAADYSSEQGLTIAKQLHIAYPFKKIFIYSAHDISDFGECPEEIKIISKQNNSSDLVAIFDAECAYLWNPIKTWQFIENIMEQNHFSNKSKAYIEDLFANSVIRKNSLFNKENLSLEHFSELIPLVTSISKLVTTVIGAI